MWKLRLQSILQLTSVIKLIQQFLKEQNLTASLTTLQQETSIFANSIPPKFIQDIRHGNWPSVLEELTNLNIKPKLLMPLYEQIILELIEQKDIDAARLLLRQTDPMDVLRNTDSERYLVLEGLMNRFVFDEAAAYPNSNMQTQRNKIAKDLSEALAVVEDNRLIKLLGDALEYQISQKQIQPNKSYDIFYGKSAVFEHEDDAPVKLHYKTLKVSRYFN